VTNRERFRAVMAFQPVDRLPMIESYWWWSETLDRWHREGLPAELTEHFEIGRWFGLDMHRIVWLTRRYEIERPAGRPRNQGLAWDLDAYERLVAPIFSGPTFAPEKVTPFVEEQQQGDVFLWVQIDGFFWFAREVLGVERHLLAFYDQPDLLHRISRDLLDYTLRLIDELCAICTPDLVSFAEDMSYNHGPMISKACFDEFMAPYYQQVVPGLVDRGVIPILDSDGDVTELVPWLEEVGIQGLSPLERMAGNNVAGLRQRHSRFRMFGAFDKTVMHRGEAAMRAEFGRLLPVMQSGGYIPSVDHQTPPEVSLSDYRLYVSLLREYCEEAAR